MEGVPAGALRVEAGGGEGRADSDPVVAYSQPRSPARAQARDVEVQSGKRKRKTVGGEVPGVRGARGGEQETPPSSIRHGIVPRARANTYRIHLSSIHARVRLNSILCPGCVALPALVATAAVAQRFVLRLAAVSCSERVGDAARRARLRR